MHYKKLGYKIINNCTFHSDNWCITKYWWCAFLYILMHFYSENLWMREKSSQKNIIVAIKLQNSRKR
jgi:hypothetical protein